MNLELLERHIKSYLRHLKNQTLEKQKEQEGRAKRVTYYQAWSKDKLLKMSEEEVYQYISKLWAMLIWGNKHYVVDKLINDNGLGNFRKELANLVWGEDPIEKRWDGFRSNVKGLGPAMMSEILCHVHPDKYMVWNRRAYVGFNYLRVEKLPRYDYQIKGATYKQLSNVAKIIAEELKKEGLEEPNLLTVDYFIWNELQVEDNLSQIHKKAVIAEEIARSTDDTSQFIHNDIRDKIADIGQWLGFTATTERKVAEGSKVDALWEATIGNMGRVMYVFEVQTKGSIDSMLMNLLKALNNPAVQGIVAVSDSSQLEKIAKHAAEVRELGSKLRCWNYEEVLDVHEKLQRVNESINKLGLVPEGF